MIQASEPRLGPSETSAPAASPIRVALVEDIREVREGLAALINGTRGFRCIGSYYSMEAALTGIGSEAPDVILTDIGLPGMSGIRRTEILRQRFHLARIGRRHHQPAQAPSGHLEILRETIDDEQIIAKCKRCRRRHTVG